MTWKGAPILASPSEIRNVGGQRLELHFDGRKLRLVAWRTGKAVYWVSNTLESRSQQPADAGNCRLADARLSARARSAAEAR